MMRVGVFPWLVVGPIVVVAGCFEIGVVDVAPPDGGAAGSASSSTTSGVGGVGGAGGAGGMGSATSTSGAGAMGGMGMGGATGSTSTGASSSTVSSGAGGAGGSGMGTGGAGGSGGAPPVCPTVADTPTMVKLQAPAGGPFYCIDTTEVTNTQYLKWMATNPDVAMQIAECASWNTSLAPAVNPTPNALPVANVDWCDAYTFCETHGKRLCGRVGGGPVGWMESVADSTKSEWQNGCSAGNSVAYPYGNTYDGLKCNGKDQDAAADKVVAVGSSPNCVGGFPGILDMSGNVWEWENTCDNKTGANDNCRRRGGGYTSQMVDMDCSSAVAQTRSSTSSTVGFRCCTDPQ